MHFTLHPLHPLFHVEDDFDAGQINAEIASEGEDDLETLEMLEAWAERLGCDTRTVRSGHRALEVGRVFKPHVVIADYLLDDELTGEQLCEETTAGRGG